MNNQNNRRQFIKKTSAAAAGLWFIGKAESFGKKAISPNEKLNIGVIGVANRAFQNIKGVDHQNIVAMCDVDESFMAGTKKDLPGAKTYFDYRKMLEQKDIDAVVVSTPDHTHAIATIDSLNSGRHVYCEKPLTHTISETRAVMKTAARNKKLATQMGTQIHATDNYRRIVELLQSGAIGTVRDVHVWVDSAYTAPGKPTEKPPVPANLHWDQWLGPVPFEPYFTDYHPRWWRRYWKFGGGSLGDMGCHHVDLSHWALGLRYPTSVETEGPTPDAYATCPWLIARYEYPANGKQPPVKLTWYHGVKDGKDVRPPHFAEGKLPKWGNGSLFVGDKGMLLGDYGHYVLLPQKDFAGFQTPKHSIPRSMGHHEEWIHACKTGAPTTCNFEYAGALTESILLGNVAFRTGKKIEWDFKEMRAKNCPEADQYIQHQYRDGWKI
jgi:predicted dehydrogenase